MKVTKISEIMLILERERIARRMSREEWCDMLDISESTYKHWYYGNCKPATDGLLRVLDQAGFEVLVGRKCTE